MMLYYVICANKWFMMLHSEHTKFCDAVKTIQRLKNGSAKMNWEFWIDEEKQIDEEICEGGSPRCVEKG